MIMPSIIFHVEVDKENTKNTMVACTGASKPTLTVKTCRDLVLDAVEDDGAVRFSGCVYICCDTLVAAHAVESEYTSNSIPTGNVNILFINTSWWIMYVTITGKSTASAD